MSENNTKQELWDGIEVFAIIDPNKKQTLRNFILQLGETVLSEIADTAAESKDHSAIHSCIAAIHMPEDIDNPEKIKKVAQDILHENSESRYPLPYRISYGSFTRFCRHGINIPRPRTKNGQVIMRGKNKS